MKGKPKSAPSRRPRGTGQLPSPEWLAEMMLRHAEHWQPDPNARLFPEEVRHMLAQSVLSYYSTARAALDVASGRKPDPLNHPDIFSQDEIARGHVKFGTQKRRGWINLVTQQRNMARAEGELASMVDWENADTLCQHKHYASVAQDGTRGPLMAGRDVVRAMKDAFRIMPLGMVVEWRRRFEDFNAAQAMQKTSAQRNA